MSFILVVLILLSIFSDLVYRIFPEILHLDEALFFAFLILGIFALISKRRKLPHILKTGMIWFVMFLLMLTISTIIHKYQTGFEPIIKDIVAFAKFPIIVIFGAAIFTKTISFKTLCNLRTILKIITVVIFVFALINMFMDVGMSDNGFRHGLKTYRFLFSHETFLVSSVVSMMAILCTEKRFNAFIAMNLFILVVSGRDKALLFIIVFFLFLVFNKLRTKGNKLIFVIVATMILAPLVLIFLYNKIFNEYIYYWTTTARLAFIVHGFDLAVDSFPFGTGFATWGTSNSGYYYSVLYHLKGMESIYGIEFNGDGSHGNYWSDTFWPSIYTQGGFIGFIFYVAMLVCIFKYHYGIYFGVNKRVRFSIQILMAYAVIASLLEAYFINDSGVTLALLLVVFFSGKVYVPVKKTVKVVKEVPVQTLTSQESSL